MYWDVGHTRHCKATMHFYFVLSVCSRCRASDWFSLSAFVRVFCVHLKEEVTAGGPASVSVRVLTIRIWKFADLTSIHLDSHPLLRHRVQHHPPHPAFFPLRLANPTSPSSLPKPFILLSSTLLPPHHSRSVFFLEFPSTVELKAASLSPCLTYLSFSSFFFFL